ncbi:urate hydroxylase PuuD [Ferrovibrio sp.]|uniref:urate hydroxylase PuuD n=1 Tax=Ferrovibrio sp. TaxID=1917215 RepID=UPI001B725169|nr:urate hydroxylase PuuD [Ferrovibrio sp.]MBP7064292.1 urate hydroxylase PuuD [Ferrovibrio sp.]
MAKILENLYRALGAGIVLTVVVFLLLHRSVDQVFIAFFVRWLHVLSGILWIGLLWYFNFVQIPTMPKIPAELKPAVGKFIAPEALFWFRWAAVATVVTGLVLSVLNGYGHNAFMLKEGSRTIGIGMWLGLFMAANVWFIIWPNQKKALGIVPTDDASKAAAARVAMLGSRTNFVLSLPMLYCMVAQQNVG